MSLGNLDQLVLATDTAGTQLEPYFTAIPHQGNLMNVRLPAPVGVPLRMTNIVAELRCFTA